MGWQTVNVTFITGNQGKADFLAKHLGIDIPHKKVELDELQSLDLHEIVEHKVKQAYMKIKKPVLVEDVSFTFDAMGRLPGPFVKWFLEELGNEGICDLLTRYSNHSATGYVCFGYFDGKLIKFFDGKVEGSVPERPRGSNGFGWDSIFIPKGTNKTYAEMNEEEVVRYGLRTSTVYPRIKAYLRDLDKK